MPKRCVFKIILEMTAGRIGGVEDAYQKKVDSMDKCGRDRMADLLFHGCCDCYEQF